jgi:hypothetical protein
LGGTAKNRPLELGKLNLATKGRWMHHFGGMMDDLQDFDGSHTLPEGSGIR